jgi:hypothetical protein
MRRSRYYESSEKEICSPFAKSKRKKPVFPRTSRASNSRTGLSKLALLLFRCTGHDDMWGPIISEECNVRPNTSSRPGGPVAKREPSPEGLGY